MHDENASENSHSSTDTLKLSDSDLSLLLNLDEMFGDLTLQRKYATSPISAGNSSKDMNMDSEKELHEPREYRRVNMDHKGKINSNVEIEIKIVKREHEDLGSDDEYQDPTPTKQVKRDEGKSGYQR